MRAIFQPAPIQIRTRLLGNNGRVRCAGVGAKEERIRSVRAKETHLREGALGKNDEQAGLAACTIADNNKLSADFGHFFTTLI